MTWRDKVLECLSDGREWGASEVFWVVGIRNDGRIIRQLRALRSVVCTMRDGQWYLQLVPVTEKTCGDCLRADWATNDRGQVLWGRPGRCALHGWPIGMTTAPACAGFEARA